MSVEIIICHSCKGHGTIICEELVDYHKREYSTWTETCCNCNGTGRLEIKTSKITTAFEPKPADPTRK